MTPRDFLLLVFQYHEAVARLALAATRCNAEQLECLTNKVSALAYHYDAETDPDDLPFTTE
jgi:hypothetical protein